MFAIPFLECDGIYSSIEQHVSPNHDDDYDHDCHQQMLINAPEIQLFSTDIFGLKCSTLFVLNN